MRAPPILGLEYLCGDKMGFKGASSHTINENGRVSIPSRLRDVLKSVYGDESLVLALGRSFIVAYPQDEWEKFEQKLLANPPANRKEANEVRKLYASLDRVDIDKQGRILISPNLRLSAMLRNECVVVGLYDRIEIWSKELWDAEMAPEHEDDGELGNQFNQLML